MATTVDRAFIRRAIELADLNAVRVALFQHTGDPELAALPVAAQLDDAGRESTSASVSASSLASGSAAAAAGSGGGGTSTAATGWGCGGSASRSAPVQAVSAIQTNDPSVARRIPCGRASGDLVSHAERAGAGLC